MLLVARWPTLCRLRHRAACGPSLPGAAPSVSLRQPRRHARLGRSRLCCRACIDWPTLAVLSTCAAGGAALGTRTPPGRALSGPVCAMLLAWATSLAGGVAGTAAEVSAIQLFVVQLATPLLLLGADLRAVFVRTRRLSSVFLFGSLATCCGAVLGVALLGPWLVPLGSPHDAWKLAAALCAKNIGGGLNYVAVAAGTHMSADTFAAGLVVDNIAGLCYFPLISWLGRAEAAHPVPEETEARPAIDGIDVITALALGSSVMALSLAALPSQPLLAATVLATAAATAAPRALQKVAVAGEALGTGLLYLFFATAGASAGSPLRAGEYGPFFAFVLVLYGVHLSLMLALGRAARLPLSEVLIASNANIGGPATAAALADAQGWRQLRTPGMLVGTLGNVIATGVALALGQFLLRGMMT